MVASELFDPAPWPGLLPHWTASHSKATGHRPEDAYGRGRSGQNELRPQADAPDDCCGGPGEPEWLSKLPNGPTPLQCASPGVSSRSARRPIDHPMPPDVE